MSQPLLELPGHEPQRDDSELLRRKISRLEDDLQDAKDALVDERKRSANAFRSMATLKQNLQPFYRALQMIFGELEDVEEISSSPVGSSTNQPPSEAAYRAWKQQLPPSCGKIIDALLVQPLTNAQLKTICHLGSTSVSEGIRILANNKVVEKDGSLNRLRRL